MPAMRLAYSFGACTLTATVRSLALMARTPVTLTLPNTSPLASSTVTTSSTWMLSLRNS